MNLLEKIEIQEAELKAQIAKLKKKLKQQKKLLSKPVDQTLQEGYSKEQLVEAIDNWSPTAAQDTDNAFISVDSDSYLYEGDRICCFFAGEIGFIAESGKPFYPRYDKSNLYVKVRINPEQVRDVKIEYLSYAPLKVQAEELTELLSLEDKAENFCNDCLLEMKEEYSEGSDWEWLGRYIELADKISKVGRQYCKSWRFFAKPFYKGESDEVTAALNLIEWGLVELPKNVIPASTKEVLDYALRDSATPDFTSLVAAYALRDGRMDIFTAIHKDEAPKLRYDFWRNHYLELLAKGTSNPWQWEEYEPGMIPSIDDLRELPEPSSNVLLALRHLKDDVNPFAASKNSKNESYFMFSMGGFFSWFGGSNQREKFGRELRDWYRTLPEGAINTLTSVFGFSPEKLKESLEIIEGLLNKWWDILGLKPTATKTQIKAAYRNLSKVSHPDVGGDRNQFEKLQKAYEEGLKTSAKL